MKKTFSNVSGTMGRCLLMLLISLVSLSAAATDFTDYTLGEKVALTGDSYFKFTATNDGILTFVGPTANSIDLYEDESMTTSITGKFNYGSKTYNGESYTQYKEFSVSNGKTYYFSVLNTWLLSSANKYVLGYLDGNITSLTLVESNYNEGDVFDITDTRYGQLSLTFNIAATSDDATITVPDKDLSATIEARTGNGSAIIYQLKDKLNEWIDAGSITGGETLVFTAPNVHARADESIKYGTDGTFTMNFKCPAKAHQLVDKYIPSTFKSFYVKGDKEGIVRLTFDYDVASIGEQTAVAVFRLGSADADDIYTEQFNPEEGGKISVDGKNLYIDFTDKLRTYEAMGLKTQWSNVTLSIRNVKMADGTSPYSSGAGTSGSYTYTASFSEVSSYVNYDWTPANGSDISTRDNIQLWFSNAEAVKFTGVKFYYQDKNTDQSYQTIVTNFTSSPDDNGIEYTIPLTDAIKAAKNVRVTLDGVTALDGNDHSDITVKYNPGPELTDDFKPTTISPENGSTVSTLSNITLTFDEAVTLNTPTNAKQIVFTDATTGKNIPATIAVSESNANQVVITPGAELKNTHKYTATIGHAVVSNAQYVETTGKYGRYMKELDLEYTIYTASKNYDFDMDPLEGSTLNEISSIKITTKAGRSSATYGITATSNPDKEIWIEKDGKKIATAKVIDIETANSEEASGFYITFSPAITEAGSYEVVLGDSTYYVGEGYNAEPNEKPVRLAYTIIAAPTQTIKLLEADPANESTLESLKTITVTFDQDIYGSESPITALNQSTRTTITGIIVPSMTNSKQAIITLDKQLTTSDAGTWDGNWTVTIPAGIVGDKTWDESDYMTGAVNAQAQLYYTIGSGSSEESIVTADPSDKSTVTSLKTITLTFVNYESAGNGMTEELATVTDGNGTVLQSFDCNKPEFGAEWNQMVVSLTDKITADGTYTISFPEGFFTLNDTTNSPAFTLTYYIGDAAGISGINTDAEGTPTIFTIGGQKVAKANQSGIYIINGKKTVIK